MNLRKDNRGSLTFYYLSLIILVFSVFLISAFATHRLYAHMQAESAFVAACLSVASSEFPDEGAMAEQAKTAFLLCRPEANISEVSVQRSEDRFVLGMKGSVKGTEFDLCAEYIYEEFCE